MLDSKDKYVFRTMKKNILQGGFLDESLLVMFLEL